MTTNELFDIDDEQNRDAYDDLIVSVEAKTGKLSLLIAVCDDASFRDEIIAKYEEELQPEIRPYRVTLARGEPSLKRAISDLVQREEYLRAGRKAVITVTGVEQLYFLKLGEDRSEQEIFFGYLQWTREGLREFPYPIILWVTNQILPSLIKKAPDFWSWRDGVFHFVSKKSNTVSTRDIEAIRSAFRDLDTSIFEDDNPYFLPIEDLKRLIEDAEKSGTKDASLATLYFSLGNIYRKRLNRGECQDYKQEQELAIQYLSKAVTAQKELGLEKELTISLNNLATLYESTGKYSEAESLYLQALTLTKRLLGDEHPYVAVSLNNLAGLYESTGRYSEAKSLYLQALTLTKRLLGDEHPYVAASLNNLALLYQSTGRYSEAEPFLVQALILTKRLLGDEHPYVATSLNNLALSYQSTGRYSEAEPLYLQALVLRKRLLGDEHPQVATSLNNLAGLYRATGRYSEAEPLYLQALALRKRLFGTEHPDVANSLNNLAFLYESTGKLNEAEILYLQALDVCQRCLGAEHPNTLTTKNNLASLWIEGVEKNVFSVEELRKNPVFVEIIREVIENNQQPES